MIFYGQIFALALIFIVELKICLAADDDNPVLTIEDGQIRGRKAYTVGQNNTYYAFQGIPYAQPPLGDLRFTAPTKNSNWTGILNTTEDRCQCVQGSNPVVGSEDCLYINVYTPSLSLLNLTVMVWVYGGAFVGGNSSYAEFGPDYLLDEGVIFVSMNYRVGVFGFLSTEDEACSGNWGLKDQVLALQWVQSNIGYFGGNPEDVTLFGESAGAVSVSYLLQTHKTKGLFSKAIMQSGTSLNLWALNRKAERTAFTIGTTLGILTTNSSDLIASLRQISYTTLQTASTLVSTLITLENALEGIYFAPVMEPAYAGALIVNNSENLLSEGDFHKIPTIMGVNSNEAAAVGTIPLIFRIYLLIYDIETEDLAPIDLSTSYSTRLSAAQEIKSYYFGDGLIATSTDQLIQFISDDQFNRPTRQAVIEQSKNAPVYYYVFSYQGVLGGVTINRTLEGVGHGEDLGYIFRRDYPGVTQNDTLVRSRIVRMWTNFAKYGTPTPFDDALLQQVAWREAGPDSSNLTYLNIGIDLELEQNPFETNMDFYDEIYAQYGEPPYNTY